MSKSFDEILQESFKLRRETKAHIKDTISLEELEAIRRRAHFENTYLINMRFGRFGSKDNVLAR